MPRVILIGSVLIVGLLAMLYAMGGDRIMQAWAAAGQETAQNAMARGLRALRAEEPGALAGFLAVCFGYGFFHAVGPGHGKLLIGGYGAASAVSAPTLAGIALLSSLAQALSAIALVGLGLWIWAWGRVQITDLAEDVFMPISFAAIAAIGLWLVLRGLRGFWRLRPMTSRPGQSDPVPAHGDHAHSHDHIHSHDHAHGPGAPCSTCGHAHMPDPTDLAAAETWRDKFMLIGAVAIRPCTGALFVLILTAQLEIFWTGIAGTIAMALGTASVTVAIAVASVTLRTGVLSGLSNSRALSYAQPMLEVGIGAIVAVLAGQLALAAL